MDGTRALLRHTVATVAYRGAKALRGAPESFAGFQAGPESRTPLHILAHLGDLFDWALSIAQGAQTWKNAEPTHWDTEVDRFFWCVSRFDAYLESDQLLAVSVSQLFQGPIADALTHVGQLTMLRRLAGSPVKVEDYFAADISIGRVGAGQAPPRREFD